MSRSFNGTSDYLIHAAAPVAAMPLSMACWAKLTDTGSAQTLLGLDRSGSNGGLWIRAEPQSGGGNVCTMNKHCRTGDSSYASPGGSSPYRCTSRSFRDSAYNL